MLQNDMKSLSELRGSVGVVWMYAGCNLCSLYTYEVVGVAKLSKTQIQGHRSSAKKTAGLVHPIMVNFDDPQHHIDSVFESASTSQHRFRFQLSIDIATLIPFSTQHQHRNLVHLLTLKGL